MNSLHTLENNSNNYNNMEILLLKDLLAIFLNLIEQSAPYISIFLDFVNLCVEIRYLIGWFLNINPYFEPFLTLWVFTDPFLWTGKGIYPRILNLELTPMINHRIITTFRQNLDAFVYYRKTQRNYYEILIQINCINLFHHPPHKFYEFSYNKQKHLNFGEK
jgi:hypothetical protein